MGGVPRLTLDTNLLHEYWKQRGKRKVVEKLLLLASQGEVDLAVTARAQEDIPHPPLAEKLSELQELNISETSSVARLDYLVLGRDMLGDKAFGQFWPIACALAEQNGKKPPDWRDWDHLHAHYLLGRDVFLTWDKGIICLSEELKARFGILVKKPEDYLYTFNATSAIRE